jgi:dolichol-phosphate mannosyltransferase
LLKEHTTPLISIVVPVYNEEEVLPELYSRLDAAVRGIGHEFEFVFVDDGSRDRSMELVAEYARSDIRVHGVLLSRNFGHEAAIHAGLIEARGDAVIVMDADLQDLPEALPELIGAWESGADVAYAVRHDRKEGAVQRAAFSAYYRIATRIVDIELPRDAGPFSLMSRSVVDAINSMSEYGRYFPGIRAFVGFRQVPITVERGARHAGETKYSFVRRASGALNAIFSFSKLPLQAVSLLGLVASGLAVLGAIWVIIGSMLNGNAVPGWVSLASIVLLASGVQLLTLGIVGEYVGKVFDEVRARPGFIVARRIGPNGLDSDADRRPTSARSSQSDSTSADSTFDS